MFKKISLICLFLIFVCCLSAVCAADLNQTNDVNVGVSCVNGTTDDINVDEVDESQDLDSVSGDLDRVEGSEISAIECSSATSHASAGHKIISNILILNHTNGTHFPVPYFPGDHKPVSSVLILNHTNRTNFPVPFFPEDKKPVSFVSNSTVGNTNGTAVCSAGDKCYKGE